MLLRDVKNQIDIKPGLPRKEFITRCYAMEIFEMLMSSKNLIVFDDVEKLGTITENNLLIGFWDWDMYSHSGSSLFWTDDITMRLFEKKGLTPEELEILTGGKDLLSLQADFLKEAANFLLNILKGVGIHEPVTVGA